MLSFFHNKSSFISFCGGLSAIFIAHFYRCANTNSLDTMILKLLWIVFLIIGIIFGIIGERTGRKRLADLGLLLSLAGFLYGMLQLCPA